MGQEGYNNKIIELLNKLPDPESVLIESARDNDTEEEEDRDDTGDGWRYILTWMWLLINIYL